MLSGPSVHHCLRMPGQRGSENLAICLDSRLENRQFLCFQDLRHSQCGLLRKTLNYILSVTFFVAGTATVQTPSKTVFTGRSRELSLASKVEVSNNTMKEIRSLQLMSIVLITIESKKKNTQKEREHKNGRL